ncbi:hypothetical protein [Marinobacter sp.]|uniref:hypothetical protein n=1 Tax=Marinobacter sp. TaxID=50741 RepID=UPI0035639B97
MDILKTLTHSLSALDQMKRAPAKEVVRVEDARPVPAEAVSDRRMQPDRRRRQLPFKGPDRRHKGSRRSPKLLNPRTRQPAELEDRRGRNISTNA